MKIVGIRHEHRVTILVDRDGTPEEAITLEQIQEFLDEARVEGAPNDALAGIDYGFINHPHPENMMIIWRDDREPLGHRTAGDHVVVAVAREQLKATLEQLEEQRWRDDEDSREIGNRIASEGP